MQEWVNCISFVFQSWWMAYITEELIYWGCVLAKKSTAQAKGYNGHCSICKVCWNEGLGRNEKDRRGISGLLIFCILSKIFLIVSFFVHWLNLIYWLLILYFFRSASYFWPFFMCTVKHRGNGSLIWWSISVQSAWGVLYYGLFSCQFHVLILIYVLSSCKV